jgi:DNA mismatch repair protein PMS2
MNIRMSVPARDLPSNKGDVLSAAPALSTVLTRGDFAQMVVLGQFNLGFLVCELGEHLFIVDQHAADEKIRYERNWKDSKILTQPLLAPLSLELNAADELILIEKREIFERNGFKVTIDRDALIGDRARVVGVPSAKGVTFGDCDVRELISIIAESEDASQQYEDVPKLPKLHSLFASKACRSAIMIGTALSLSQMTRLLNQLASLDQPWNCPHGRPTMRHLAHTPILLERVEKIFKQHHPDRALPILKPAKRNRIPTKQHNCDGAKRPRQA